MIRYTTFIIFLTATFVISGCGKNKDIETINQHETTQEKVEDESDPCKGMTSSECSRRTDFFKESSGKVW